MEISSITDIVSLVILGLFGLTMITSILFGIKRGFAKALLRLITVVVSFVISLMVATLALDSLAGAWEGMTLLELIDSVPQLSGYLTEEYRAIVACYDVQTIEPVVNLLGALLILPLTFVIIFHLLKFVTYIVYFILGGILSFMKREKSALSRLLGAALGAVQGLVIFAVLMVPISGYVATVADLKAPLTAEEMPPELVDTVNEVYDTALAPLTEDPVINAFGALGCRGMFNSITTVKMNGEKVNMAKEVRSLAYLYIDTIPLTDIDFTAPTEQDRDIIEGVVADATGDAFLSGILSGALRGTSLAFNSGALVFPLEEPFATLGMEMISIFTESSPDNLDDDLGTILNVYFILAEHGILGADGDFTEALTSEINGERCLDRVIAELRDNDHTKHLVSAITKLSVSMLSEAIGEEAVEVYENVKQGVSEVLSISKEGKTEEQYKAEVHTKLDETFKENGIEVDEEVLQGMTDYVNENSDELSHIADEDLDMVILSYYDAYSKYMEEHPDATPDDFIDDMGGEGGAEGSEGGAEGSEGGAEGSEGNGDSSNDADGDGIIDDGAEGSIEMP